MCYSDSGSTVLAWMLPNYPQTLISSVMTGNGQMYQWVLAKLPNPALMTIAQRGFVWSPYIRHFFLNSSYFDAPGLVLIGKANPNARSNFLFLTKSNICFSSSLITDIHRLRKPTIRSTESGAAEINFFGFSNPFPILPETKAPKPGGEDF